MAAVDWCVSFFGATRGLLFRDLRIAMAVERRRSRLVDLEEIFALHALAAILRSLLSRTSVHLIPCLCLAKGVCSIRVAFLSTAAPRRGALPDPEQQPSLKSFSCRGTLGPGRSLSATSYPL